jgi:hypothetical protein
MILSWYENCTKEEVPPEYLWEDSEGLDMWWAQVKERRNSGLGFSDRNDSPSEDGDESDHGPGTAENDLARILKNG